ncbi:MAG: hypothetical protein JO079_05550 [Frankiaceae bacterium]|nr:hypothetical protein [Frankiaceae bacterium]
MDHERPGRSGLVNALWGGNISYPSIDAQRRARLRRVVVLTTLAIAAGTGLVVGLVDSAAWGAVAAVLAVLVLGLVFRATVRDYS